ncbi:MAG: FAD-dependent oxidoreductase [Anaerolineae bacterium]
MANIMIRFEREIPIRRQVDVLVAGGGPAGVAAAVAAARTGARVYLVEGASCLGGMGTLGLVPCFMQFGDGINFLAAGIGREVHDRLWQAGGVGPDDRIDERYGHLGIQSEVLKTLYDDMLSEAGVQFSLHTQLIAVEQASGQVNLVICAAKSGIYAIEAQVFIDCTGDGDLCAWAGAPCEKGDAQGHMMPGTLCSLWTDIDWDMVRAAGQSAEAELPKAFAAGIFTTNDRHLPGMWRIGQHMGGGNIGHAFGVDATDEDSLTQALVRGRKTVREYEQYYKRYLQGFEQMELAATGALLGIRESRRVMGDYVLSLEDFKRRAVFEDEIGRYCYPVDIHASTPSDEAFEQFRQEITTLHYGPGESYGIPYRCLLPRGLKNVLVAGRCISSDRYIQGSVRVMPGCYITGQAAGVAAALALNTAGDTRQVNAAELQTRLSAMGAYLPNKITL